jgi:hypothetical protein
LIPFPWRKEGPGDSAGTPNTPRFAAGGGDMKALMKKMAIVFSVLAFFAFGLAGCEKEGPAEKAGKEIDQAFDSAKKELDKATGH